MFARLGVELHGVSTAVVFTPDRRRVRQAVLTPKRRVGTPSKVNVEASPPRTSKQDPLVASVLSAKTLSQVSPLQRKECLLRPQCGNFGQIY